MKMSMFRICAIVGIGLAASLQTLQAQQKTLEGVWDVSVAVTACDTGVPIRMVQSLQAFHRDRSMTETANTASRGISEGAWQHAGGQKFVATYWFFRYKTDGTFASFAKAVDNINLVSDGKLTSTGLIKDYDANGNLLSTGCFVHTAYRLIDSEQ